MGRAGVRLQNLSIDIDANVYAANHSIMNSISNGNSTNRNFKSVRTTQNRSKSIDPIAKQAFLHGKLTSTRSNTKKKLVGGGLPYKPRNSS